jgi:hypothetical protein
MQVRPNLLMNPMKRVILNDWGRNRYWNQQFLVFTIGDARVYPYPANGVAFESFDGASILATNIYLYIYILGAISRGFGDAIQLLVAPQ